MTGVYVDSDPAHLARFEQWLGAPADAVLGYTGDRDWRDMDPGWIMGQFPDHPVLLSIPLFPQTSSLAAVAAGAEDGHFRAFADKILANAGSVAAPDGNIYVRTGWEVGNEGWPWTQQAKGDPAAFREAFADFADAFHSASPKFKVVWDAAGDRGDVTQYYPGDQHVDVVSQDFYWQPQWSSYDGGDAFAYYAGSSQGQGLNELKAFAAAHGKPFAVSEWGVKPGLDGTEFIQAAAKWFDDNDVLWATYWDSDAGHPGRLSDGSDPASGAAFRDAFGMPS